MKYGDTCVVRDTENPAFKPDYKGPPNLKNYLTYGQPGKLLTPEHRRRLDIDLPSYQILD